MCRFGALCLSYGKIYDIKATFWLKIGKCSTKFINFVAIMEKFIVSARKYRPATFTSVVGQSHITSTLKNAIERGQLAHAYLFKQNLPVFTMIFKYSLPIFFLIFFFF